MTRGQARESARDILEIIPLVMRTVAAELRAAGEMPAPAHFGLLSILSVRPRMLTDLASIQGVSLPTMSNSISAMVERGWVRRAAPEGDRRVVMIEVTPTGRAALERVTRAAEAHLADLIAPLDLPARRRPAGGLGVLKASSPRRRRPPRKAHVRATDGEAIVGVYLEHAPGHVTRESASDGRAGDRLPARKAWRPAWLGVIFSPRATYAAVAAQPRWLGVFLACCRHHRPPRPR